MPAEPNPHVLRPVWSDGALTHCACGNPWPCPHSPEGWWQALKDYLGRQIDTEDRYHHGYVAAVEGGHVAGSDPTEVPLVIYRNTLARMRELEAGR
jgi:hypothetical protein